MENFVLQVQRIDAVGVAVWKLEQNPFSSADVEAAIRRDPDFFNSIDPRQTIFLLPPPPS